MPDLSKYSPEKPFVPTIFSEVNLGNAFIPSVELPGVNSPSRVGAGSNDDPWNFFLRTTGRNPFSGLGVVPAGPAAMDEYWANRKFTSEADSYQSGNTYQELGFLIGRDNESLFAKNRSWWDESFNTAVRLLDKTGAYAVQGFGFLGGLVGIGNKNENYSGNGFANWIAGASDNALSVWAREVADETDNIYRPIYQEAEDKEKGFFRRMVTDSEFWKGDAVDGVAFLGGAYLTGNLGQILNVGGKAVRGIAAARGLNFAERAAALSDEGLSGLSQATNLSKGATAVEGAPVVANTFSPNAGTVYSRFLNEAGNFANARKINMGVSTLINTASESLFEASSIKNDIAERLSSEKNADGTFKYTPDQVKNIAANAAKNSFLMNMMVLPLSNLWEAKMFYGKVNPLSARNADNSLIKRGAGLLSNSEVAKRTFGQRAFDYLKNTTEGVLKEGLWEENIQLAIERINKDPENIDEGFFTNIGRVLNQYAVQTGSALIGNDTEASTSIGLGGLIGGGMSVGGRFRDIKAVKRDVANYNNAINSFKTSAKDLYEKNDDGSLRLNDQGEPIVNATNVLSYISSMNKTLHMSELADNLKEKNMDVLHSIVDNENISRLVKAYADNGLADSLIQKLDDSKGYKPEDLMLLGLNPDKAEGAARIEEIKKKVTEYKNIYDNIEKNFFVKLRNDDRNGSKARLMKDKLYYLSTRATNLAKLKSEVDSRRQTNQDQLATSYPSDTGNDSLADRLNELYGRYNSTKKRVDYLSTEQRRITDGNRMIEESSEEVVGISDGVTLTKKKKAKPVPKEQFAGVEEEELNDAVNNMTSAEKELKEFLEQNKDSVKKMKKNADGTFRYDNEEKNRLTYDNNIVKDRNIALDLEQARNATLNVFNRLSDIKYGERYFDNVYSKRKQDLYNNVVEDESQDLDQNIEDPSPNPDQPLLPGSPAQRLLENGIRSQEEWEESIDDLNKLKRERDSLNAKEDATLEDEVRIDELEKQIKSMEGHLDTLDEVFVESAVSSSGNIPERFKADYKRILDEIAKNRRNTVKYDTYYEINGDRYAKVSDVIGNVVPEELRPSLQGALAAGYTTDSIVKAYFGAGITDAFRQEIATKISEEALAKLVKQLESIRNKLRNDGIDIVANNVVVYDSALKVAGEIDLLGVDKHGNFKIYEIEARQGRVWAQIATKSGRGPAIYEMTQKQLSAYRNLFSNLYGATPNSISVMFPIDVKYDREANTGFIEKVNLKPELRYPPTANVSIKSNVFQPIRVGSKYDSYDMTSLFINSFIPKSMDVVRDKLRFLLRNQTFDNIKKGVVLEVKDSEQSFQEIYANQQKVLAGQSVPGYEITKHPSLNLYSLRGNKEISIKYDGQLLGFMPPFPTLAYKAADGTFKILDENTDVQTYKDVTGNSEQTYAEFVNISRAYKKAYNELTQDGDKKLTNKEVQEMFDVQMSYGELDLVNVGQDRVDLGDLAINGVKVGNAKAITVLHTDENGVIRVMMDKKMGSKTVSSKYYEIDRWANNNSDAINKAAQNRRGEKVTDYTAIIETPNGDKHVIALRLKKDAKIIDSDYDANLGTKFTSSTTKNVFKNESVSLIPKKTSVEATIKLKGDAIISNVYPTENVESLEKFGVIITDALETLPVETVVNNFIKSADAVTIKKINSMFAAYPLTPDELATEIIDDFNAGNWDTLNSYLEQLMCD